jgi:N,N'-diacetyllegionaminate synthase
MLNEVPKIIAEVGVNHNGSLNLAKKLIKISKNAGAHFVKFQMFDTESHILKSAQMTNYQKKNLSSKISQFKMAKKYELSFKDFSKLNKFCKKNKIHFLASVFDVYSFHNYLKFNCNYIKIPSGEITNFELLNEISKFKFTVFLSTGMSNINEINNAIKLLKSRKKIKDIIVMQCTTEYPSKLSNSNLLTIPNFKFLFKCDVGYSDHTLGAVSAIIAVTLGANVIEKHLTLDKNLKGPDHKASCDPIEFIKFTKNLKQIKEIMGSKIKKLLADEKKNINFVRKSIVASKDIKKGDIFTEKNITAKRPRGGICASNYLRLINKKAKFNFIKDEKIKL